MASGWRTRTFSTCCCRLAGRAPRLFPARAAGKNEGAPPRDLFDLMGAARDPETGEAFSDEQLGDEVATMILAGHETTATALFWSLYLLALDPATKDEVAAEVKSTTVD